LEERRQKFLREECRAYVFHVEKKNPLRDFTPPRRVRDIIAAYRKLPDCDRYSVRGWILYDRVSGNAKRRDLRRRARSV